MEFNIFTVIATIINIALLVAIIVYFADHIVSAFYFGKILTTISAGVIIISGSVISESELLGMELILWQIKQRH